MRSGEIQPRIPILVLSCALFLTAGSTALGQATSSDIIWQHLARGDAEGARKLASRSQHSGPADETLLFRALFEKDGARALNLYNDLLLLHKSSRYTPFALYKIGQYYYAAGFCRPARKRFEQLAAKFPNIELAAISKYYIARCLLEAGETDSARVHLEILATENLPATLSGLVREELQHLRQEGAPPAKPPVAAAPAADETVFTVQVGAYSSRRNAENQKRFLGRVGYAAQIAEAQKNGKRFFRVLTGRFENRAAASKFAESLRRRHRITYRVITIEEAGK